MQQPSWTSRVSVWLALICCVDVSWADANLHLLVQTFLVQSSRRDTSTSSGTRVTSPSCLDERGGGVLACLQVGPHFKTTLHQKRHFAEYELAITDLNLFLEKLHTGAFNETLFVTHASRSDIVTGYLVYAATYERMTVGHSDCTTPTYSVARQTRGKRGYALVFVVQGKAMQGGILLSGSPSTPFGAWPDQALRKCIESSSVPILFTHVSTSETVLRTCFWGGGAHICFLILLNCPMLR